MRILDRYILRTFLINVAILLLIILVLTLLIDLLLELPAYISAGRARAEAKGGPVILWAAYSLVHFNGPVLLLMFTLFSGPMVTAAIGFTYRTLQRGGELMVMLTSGISMLRVAAPVILVGTMINLMSLPLKEFVIPPMAHLLLRHKGDSSRDKVKVWGFRHAPDAYGNLFSADIFDIEARMIGSVTVLVRNQEGHLMQRISAATGHWNQGRVGWVLEDVQLVDKPFAQRPDGSVRPQITPLEAHFIPSDLSPDILLARQESTVVRLMSLKGLNQMLASPSADSYRSEVLFYVHNRFSFPIVHVLVTLMTMPVFMRREPGSELGQSLKAVVICGTAWMGAVVMQQVADGPFNTVLAAWLPVIVYLPLTAVLLQRVRS